MPDLKDIIEKIIEEDSILNYVLWGAIGLGIEAVDRVQESNGFFENTKEPNMSKTFISALGYFLLLNIIPGEENLSNGIKTYFPAGYFSGYTLTSLFT